MHMHPVSPRDITLLPLISYDPEQYGYLAERLDMPVAKKCARLLAGDDKPDAWNMSPDAQMEWDAAEKLAKRLKNT